MDIFIPIILGFRSILYPDDLIRLNGIQFLLIGIMNHLSKDVVNYRSKNDIYYWGLTIPTILGMLGFNNEPLILLGIIFSNWILMFQNTIVIGFFLTNNRQILILLPVTTIVAHVYLIGVTTYLIFKN